MLEGYYDFVCVLAYVNMSERHMEVSQKVLYGVRAG